ncbi:peptidase M16 [Anaerocolumna cellulosilytica]|uniref:Peptidase M16 n=1 Tax=Anaerocolumna cellulosilytica TaxID=433286 RepID=A0A6S6R6U5_9FIRM|nr:pitrilysin family protein [Anaerocolumna cellulosilytica]MBB5197968.1 putative Zn-dependent peptidase [Anaerocolumna cellulosilytica]BCJ95152.1 peptidase M16 [Anaerocolumna cellulosilytica]
MVNRRKLSNGITVVLETMPYLRSAAFGIWVKVGSSNENEKNNGISHIIEHMLFKGTKNRTARQIADDMARIGGDINAYTSKECTSFYAVTLDEHLPIAIEILGDMLNNSLFDEKALEKEKGVILEEIDMYDDSPEDLVHEMLQMKIWDKHPLGYQISGSKKTVKAITRDEILQFMKKYYVSGNMVISVAGNFREEEIVKHLEKNFSAIPEGERQQDCTIPVYHPTLYTKQKDVEQLHLNMAFQSVVADAEEKYTLTILNSVFGGSINSRLFQEIRENRGLTYTIYSYGSSYKKAGLLQVYGAMNPIQLQQVLSNIFNIIEELKTTPLSEDELSMSKEQIKTELIMGNESAKSRMNSNGKSILFKDYITPLDEIINKVNEVTAKEILSFANQYLKKETASLSLVGNLENVDKIKLFS